MVKENECLRQNITNLDIEKQRELEHLRQRIEGFNEQNLETLKNQHRAQIFVMEGEINKLRSLLEVKNREIETLIQQNMRLKQNYEAENTELRLEIESLKNKVLDLERIHRS